MSAEPQPVTLAQVVHRAVEVCDDSKTSSLDELLGRFEDADEPVSAIGDVEQLLIERVGPLELDDGDAAFTMARAVIVYLAHRRDEIDADPVELLTLAARAEFRGQPPEDVANWLAQQGIAV